MDQENERGTIGQALRPFALFVLLVIVVLQGSRIGLVAWQYERVEAAGGLGYLLIQGLRFDLVALGMMLIIPVILAPLAFVFRSTYRLGERVLATVLALQAGLFLTLELATPSFLEEYDTRPNYLFVEYLKYPEEVLSTLWGAYPLQLILMCAAAPLTVWVSRKALLRGGGLAGPLPPIKAALLSLLLAITCFVCARSTMEHRPVNPSTVCYSSDAMVNSLPLNSLYSAGYATYEMGRNEAAGNLVYGDMPLNEVLETVRADSGIPLAAFDHPDIPTLHHQRSREARARPFNFVIILEESLGAEFVGAMGGLPLTPNLDELLAQGLSFDRLYATGTRSVRGIEAIVAGFYPTPARSVVKLPRSQRNFFTLASLLGNEGYATSFIYGGESHFDNMGRFFTGNGFKTVIDHSDFEDPLYEGSWGVSDQDLFRRAHKEFELMGDRPFFSLVFSSSNHSPWEFPTGGFELHEEKVATRNNAVKYADHALGEFFALARASSYWENTVFLIVADHNSRVHGPALVPVEHFHVPGVFLGATIAPGRIETIASQVDLLPTALSLMGLDSDHPALGRDLTNPAVRALPGRAMLQYHQTNLFLEDDHAVILRAGLPAAHFRWVGGALVPAETLPELERRAIAHSLWPQLAYRKGTYRLP